MQFKITPGLNQAVKIAAFVQLFIFIFNFAVEMGKIPFFRLSNIISFIGGSCLAILMPLYIAGILNFFGEKKSISRGFMIFSVTRLLLAIVSLAAFFNPAYYGLVVNAVTGLFIVLAATYNFITSLFIKSKVILGPIVIYTTCIFVMMCLTILITIIIPWLSNSFGGFGGSFVLRRVVSYASGLLIVTPIAIILLTNRINRFCFTERPSDEPEPEY